MITTMHSTIRVAFAFLSKDDLGCAGTDCARCEVDCDEDDGAKAVLHPPTAKWSLMKS